MSTPRMCRFVNHDLAGYEVRVHADIRRQEVIFLGDKSNVCAHDGPRCRRARYLRRGCCRREGGLTRRACGRATIRSPWTNCSRDCRWCSLFGSRAEALGRKRLFSVSLRTRPRRSRVAPICVRYSTSSASDERRADEPGRLHPYTRFVPALQTGR